MFSPPLLAAAVAAGLLYTQSALGAAVAVPHLKETRFNSTRVGMPYTLPKDSSNAAERHADLALAQAGFTYGPPVGGGPYYPSGTLGAARSAADSASTQAELTAEKILMTQDTRAAVAGQNTSLRTLRDYQLLYDGKWINTLPKGPVPGILTNYTQDLLFSMERLSTSPYAVKRLQPGRDSLAFKVDDRVALNVAGMTLDLLLQTGRLFYVDFSDQGTLERTSRYAAACDAYFFIDKVSGAFLPLAIRTQTTPELIYTPQDAEADWLLAKIMYNVNDIWFSQWNHLAATHETIQIIWMAAIRTLSEDHPIYGLLNRLMYQVFGVQPLAADLLFSSGAEVDKLFAFTGTAAQSYTTKLYNNGRGAFQANYFLTDLEARGLINAKVGPKLLHFPFYEDGLAIWEAIRAFMTSFVESYYTSDAAVQLDEEVQAWVHEASGAAGVHDFPQTISTTETVCEVLTQLAHLASTAHHAVNTNELLSVSSTLPFHPLALYAAVPTAKGGNNTSVLDFLPGFDQAILQLGLGGVFARPLLAGTNRSLLHMFDDADMLGRMSAEIYAAAAKFQQAMQALSDEVSARRFDSDGLSQGMPFVWQALDPNVAPFSVSI